MRHSNQNVRKGSGVGYTTTGRDHTVNDAIIGTLPGQRARGFFHVGHRYTALLPVTDAFGRALAEGTLVEVVAVWMNEIVEVSALYEEHAPSYHFKVSAVRDIFMPTGTRCPMAKYHKEQAVC